MIRLPEGTTKTRFRCPRCATIFDLGDATAQEVPAQPAPGQGRAKPRSAPAASATFEVVPAPVVKRPKPAIEPDDEPVTKPRRKSRRDEEDEDEDYQPQRHKRRSEEDPPKKKQRRAGTGERIATAIAALALLVVVVGLGGYFLFGEEAPEEVKNTTAEPPKPEPPKPAPPAAPLTHEQMVRKVKNSTAYIRTIFQGGLAASGSGFFAGQPGFVVTNAHVLGFGPRELRVPIKVEVVQNSGEVGERVLPTTIFGIDVTRDLAILRVESPNPPEPLQFGRAAELIETQEVVIFGYPFGEQLGKNISVNRTTVSSLRQTNGIVEIVQLAGGMNPGNSGGPVTNAKGEVIGVSVAGIRTADAICFAIPAEITATFVNHQIGTGGWLQLGNLVPAGAGPPGPGAGGIVLPGVGGPPPGAGGAPPGPINPIVPGRPKPPAWAPLQIPLPAALALTPAKITGITATVKLPAVTDGACVGGGGRFLIFHLPSARQLAVFDVCEAKVAATIPAPKNALFTAGMNTLVVVDGDANTIDRWSLATFTKKSSGELPVAAGLHPVAVAMGSASDGPLMVKAVDFPRLAERFLFDVTTMTEVKGSRTNAGALAPRPGDVLRASADGRTFTHCREDGKAAVIVVTDTGYHESALPGAEAATLPGGDGQAVYAPGAIAGRTGVAVAPSGEGVYLPAVQGPLFLSLPGRGTARKSVAVHAGRDHDPLFELPPIPALTAALGRERVPIDRRVFFVPAAQVLVFLTPEADAVTLHRLDVDALLEKADAYLFVTSIPPAAVVGKSFDYRLVVKSKKPAAGFKLVSGPPGLKVSAEGRVTWTVPATFARTATVAITITGEGGDEHRHEFELIPMSAPPE